MASALLAHVEVVGRLLAVLEGAELARVGLEQSRSLSANLERIRVLSLAEKSALAAGIEGFRLDQAAKARLLTLVHGKSSGESRKRPLQDYVSWPSFCTPRIWQNIAESPSLAVEIFCQQVNSLGLINASKATQKSLAAHAVTAEFAQSPFPVSEADAKRVFRAVGKRLKQLYKAEPLEYIVKLPATPAEFLRLNPLMATAVFSRENLPCACPLDPARVSDAESKIQCRGDKEESSSGQSTSVQQMMMFTMHVASRFASNSQQTGDGDVTLLPPASPAALKFKQLTEGAVPPQHADAGSSTDVSLPASADLRPQCLQILDAGVEEQGEPVAAKTPRKADAMRGSIMAARAGLAADRAAAGALAKTAGTPRKAQKKGDTKTKPTKTTPTKKTGTPKKAAKRVEKPKSWLKARPNGCGKCRNRPGCTKSCYLGRGEKVPK